MHTHVIVAKKVMSSYVVLEFVLFAFFRERAKEREYKDV